MSTLTFCNIIIIILREANSHIGSSLSPILEMITLSNSSNEHFKQSKSWSFKQFKQWAF